MVVIRGNQRLPKPALFTMATLGWMVVLYLCWVVGEDCYQRAQFALASLAGEIPQIDPFQDRYTAHPWQTLIHTGLGLVFAVLGPLQFASPVRRAFPVLHRLSGRIYVPSAILVGLASISMGFSFPVWGHSLNWVMVVAMGVFMVFAVIRGITLARAKRYLPHREWMIRGFATGLSVAWFRVMLEHVLPPMGLDFNTSWNIVIWTSTPILLIPAEIWIRVTRPKARVAPQAGAAAASA